MMKKQTILFGSYIDLKKEPHDIDILFVIDRNNFKQYKKRLADIEDMVPAKIHDVLQTEEDLKNNIANKDKVILDVRENMQYSIKTAMEDEEFMDLKKRTKKLFDS